jgi:hypothetical protein
LRGTRLLGLRYLTVALAAALPWFAQAQPQSTPSPPQLLHPDAPLPLGPFASWPEDTREPALRAVRDRCIFMTGMAFDNYRGPKEAIGQIAMAVVSACIVKLMPDDWPGKEDERRKSVDAYEAAKRLDPNAPDPDRLASMIAQALAHPH